MKNVYRQNCLSLHIMLFPHLIKKEKYFRGQRFVDRWCQRFSCCFIVFGVAVIDSVIIVVFLLFLKR